MPHDLPTDPVPGNPAGHWGTRDPEAQPPRNLVLGLPRMVTETVTRLGPGCTPEQVCRELQAGGVEASPDEVRRAWPPDCGPSG